MLLYYSPIFEDFNIYSVDSMRINFRFHSLPALERMLQVFQEDLYVQYYSSSRLYSYQHLFTYKYGDSSFTIGCCLLSKDKSDLLKGFIDFNPNKVLGSVTYENGFVRAFSTPFDTDIAYEGQNAFKRHFRALYDDLKSCSAFELARFDIATDVQILRSRVQLLKDQRKYSQFRKSQEDLTEYLGSRSSPGYCKIYNKRIESELDYDLTRIEVTCDSLDYSALVAVFPAVYLHDDSDLSVQLELLCDLLSRLPVDEFDLYYKRLNSRQRSKLDLPLLRAPFMIPESVFYRLTDVVKSFLDGSFVFN